MLRQRPFPLQFPPPGQASRSHAWPVNPAKHLQSPVFVSHVPMLEHSARLSWMVSVAVAIPAHAVAWAHVRSEQSQPPYPAKHVHWP